MRLGFLTTVFVLGFAKLDPVNCRTRAYSNAVLTGATSKACGAHIQPLRESKPPTWYMRLALAGMSQNTSFSGATNRAETTIAEVVGEDAICWRAIVLDYVGAIAFLVGLNTDNRVCSIRIPVVVHLT